MPQTPSDVVERSPATHRGQFFEVDERGSDSGMDGMDGADGSGGGGSGSDGGGGMGMGMEGDSTGEDRSPGLSRRVSGLIGRAGWATGGVGRMGGTVAWG